MTERVVDLFQNSPSGPYSECVVDFVIRDSEQLRALQDIFVNVEAERRASFLRIQLDILREGVDQIILNHEGYHI